MEDTDGSSSRSLDAVMRAASFLLYAALGFVLTALLSIGLLVFTQPLQAVIYRLFYLQVGPGPATKAAILVHFLLVGFAALGASLLVGEYVSDRGRNAQVIGLAIGLLAILLVGFLVVSLARLAAFLTALVILALALLAVPLLIRFRYGVSSGATPAFLGGVPVLVLLLLLVGFGLGWGWGYTLTAEAVPASAVDGPVSTFDSVPEVRDDLFSEGNCASDRSVCRLELRGYDHELAATRYLAERGVRCPYQNAPSTTNDDAFFATVDGSTYRVSCSPHGD